MTMTSLKYNCACGFSTDELKKFSRHLLDGGHKDGKGVHKSIRGSNPRPETKPKEITPENQEKLNLIEQHLRQLLEPKAVAAVAPEEKVKPGKKQKIRTNSLVIRYHNGRYIGRYQYIEEPVGIPYSQGNDLLYIYTARKTEGGEELVPLPLVSEIKVLPDTLYRRLHKWWSYRQVMSEALKPTMMEKLKLGLALGFFGISATALFLIVISLIG